MVKQDALVELPGDRLYSEDCKIETFTYRDASTISLLAETQDSQKLFEIIDQRITLDVKELTLQDFWFIMHWQRINSYSSFPSKMPWTCPHCKTKNLDLLQASNLIIDDIDPEYEHGMTLDFPDSGPLEVRLKLIKDELEVKKYIRDNSIQDTSKEDFDEFLTACMLEPSGQSFKDRLDIVKNMSADDQFLIRAFEAEFDYGVQKAVNLTCENQECKEVVKVRRELDLTSFFPSVRDKSSVRSKILSNKASTSTSRLSGDYGVQGVSLPKEESSSCLEELEGAKRQSESRSQEQKGQITLTPEELQKMIQDGIKEATESDELTNLDDIVKNR